MSNPQLIDEILSEPIGSNNPMNSSNEHREVELDSSRLRSKVWPHFKRQKINGQIKAICIHCKFSLHGGSRYGTSHLKNHLNRCGKSKLVQTDLKQYQLTSGKGDSGKDIIASYVYDQNVAKKKLAHMIIMHEYPLSMVEHEGFREYCMALQPAFKSVSRNTIKKEIMEINDVEKLKTTSLIEANNCRIVITTDLWTASSQRKGYMTVTAHFVDDSWCLQSRILSGGLTSLLEQMVEALCRHVSDESPTVRSLCLKGLVQIPSIHIYQYTTQVLGVILALLDDSDESVQLTAVSCLLMILKSSPNDAVEPILLNLSVRLRNLQICNNVKMRADAFAAFGALSNYGVGAQREAFLEQIHAALPRLILHLYDDDLSVRQACRTTLRRIAPLMEMEGSIGLFNSHCFNSDHRSDYEDFVRDIARQFVQRLPSRVDNYMASTIQAFEAPWPIIQANAIYISSSMLSLSDDQHILALYYTQVFGMLVGKMSRSTDAIVRATCSSSIGLLLKSANSVSWRAARLDHSETVRRGYESESFRK